jgi:hypothetical protein
MRALSLIDSEGEEKKAKSSGTPRGLHYQIVGRGKKSDRIRSVVRHRVISLFRLSFSLPLLSPHVLLSPSILFVLVHIHFSFSKCRGTNNANLFIDLQ